MNQAIGLIEVAGLASAIKTADTMLKAANVTFKAMEKAKGSGWMVIVIEGDVGAVNAAINSGEADAKQYGKFISSKVIPRPVDGLSDFFVEKPAAKKVEDQKEPAAKKEEPAPKAASAQKETPAKAKTERATPEKPAANKASAKETNSAKPETKKPAAKAKDKTTSTEQAKKQAEGN